MFFIYFPLIGHPENIFFKSFTADLTVEEFDDIYNKEITKRYGNHEIQRLSIKRKNNSKQNCNVDWM
jgi:hypothetical protein